MKKRIFIQRLTLKGTKKDYFVNFHGGLNFISGPTSTGKTSILEMIDYVLGAKSRKNYIEIGNVCSKVELECLIGIHRYRLTRDYADISAAVIVESFDDDKNSFVFYRRCEVDLPSNPESLSAFLVENLGLADIKISNDHFSFRDLFQYSYLKQTEIDNEDIMHESDWARNNKRRAAFEIIFRFFDEQLQAYKATLKQKEEEKHTLEVRIQGIKDFLQATNITTAEEIARRSVYLTQNDNKLKSELSTLKQSGSEYSDVAKNMRSKLFELRLQYKQIQDNENEQHQYLAKLRLLYNQYQSEIDTKQLALDGFFALNKYDFILCPNCLTPLANDEKPAKECFLCKKEKQTDNEELLILRKELDTTKRKSRELLKFIASEEKALDKTQQAIQLSENELRATERTLSHATKDYINPHLEQIELLNYEIGRNNQQIDELQRSLKMIEELERLSKIISDKESSIEGLKKIIRELSKDVDSKDSILNKLNKTFTQILQAFEYPKLSNSYIHEKSYLPYVRGQKYNDLGSSGGVSLITMAYYLAILIESSIDIYPHLNLLIIDSPRKNLGAQAQTQADNEFMDEKIFNNVVRWLIKFNEEYKDSAQLIVVNNGYPDFLPKDTIVAEYDSTGRDGLPKGLIDDAE